MIFARTLLVCTAIGMTSACGRASLKSATSSDGTKDNAPSSDVSLTQDQDHSVVDQHNAVPVFFENITGHEICTGKVTEEWTNPESGLKYRQVWQRRSSFGEWTRSSDSFSVGYKVRVDSDYYVQAQDGTWQADKKSSYDSYLQFNSVWNASLSRYVGQTRWLSSHKDDVAVDLSAHSDQKITAIFAQGDKVVMKYVDIFPRAASATSPAHLSSYDETLGLVDGKLERSWSYQNWAFDAQTLEPTTPLDLGAQPSYDTEAKCAQ